jgi:type IV pilus assembly protein PilP
VIGRLGLLAVVALIGSAASPMLAPAIAQAPADKTAPPPAKSPGQGSPAPTTAIEPQGYTYDPQGRRDPFVSLLRRGADAQGSAPSTRPAGLAGLATSEVALRGTVKGRDGFVAMLEGVDKKTYLVRAGDRLFDGTIRTITADTVVILQRVNDPLSPETEREVRKVLRPTEEAKQR